VIEKAIADLDQREYWLCEGAVGAAGRFGLGCLQCHGAEHRAHPSGFADLNCRVGVNALGFRNRASVQQSDA
jgi:hypothetical protein